MQGLHAQNSRPTRTSRSIDSSFCSLVEWFIQTPTSHCPKPFLLFCPDTRPFQVYSETAHGVPEDISPDGIFSWWLDLGECKATLGTGTPPEVEGSITEAIEGDYAVLNDAARLKLLPLSKIKAAKHMQAKGHSNMEATLERLHTMGEGKYLHETLWVHEDYTEILKHLLYPLHDVLAVMTKAHLDRSSTWTLLHCIRVASIARTRSFCPSHR